jgi:hypothetical protein
MEFFMKKSILASSIAAAVFGLGAVTGAQATVVGSDSGIGDILLVPYYTAQASNATLLSITNTDTLNGKAVKVRFRGAANSDDVYDFQVFLSPTDVWTANISKGADGRAVLTTTDASCTKPSAATLNATPFVTARLSGANAEALANGTREGYVEIIGMADIPKNATTGSGVAGLPTLATTSGGDGVTNTLFTAIKHVKSVAPCSGTAFTALDTTSWPLASGASGTAAAKGLTPSTGGLMANWTIINTVNAAAWSGEAVALKATGTKNVLYVPQTSTAVASTVADLYTADPLFVTGGSSGNRSKFNATTQAWDMDTLVAPIAVAGNYDFPDLSTPMDATFTAANAAQQVTDIQTALTKSSVIAEFMTDSAINGSTDWVFSMPSRRYSIAMAYSKVSASDDGRRFNKILRDATNGSFTTANTSIVGGLICVTGAKPVPYDREENTPTSSTEVVVSPSTPGGQQLYCGEASVFSFNNGVGTTAALGASVAVTSVDATYKAGWASMSVGYPVVGGAFMKASNGAQGYGIFQAYR